ncbi:hypothetical protein KJ359_004098 [Pestalotiopsis sp. 9143b]|nr:hypothetical protein KJ359_004098 [Pestalotiopsis sp. 9143b]
MDSDDESDFYGNIDRYARALEQKADNLPQGDEATITAFESRVRDLDCNQWWAASKMSKTPLKIQSKKLAQPDVSHFHNPYAGVKSAWQLTETVDSFLDRLPPASTDEAKVGPWIFICNPYIDRKKKHQSQNQKIKGCEDEAPEEDGADLMRFVHGGMERLALVTAFHDQVKKSAMLRPMSTREMNKASLDASRDILALAHAAHVRAGKWMLFPSAQTVNEVWEIVAKATASNELGIAAKVATRSEIDPRPERLICIYTADFHDRDDVERVATKLKQLGLVEPRGKKPLYYKPDAYTYLGIGSGNAWGIKASIYNTKDMIGNT